MHLRYSHAHLQTLMVEARRFDAALVLIYLELKLLQ